MLAFAGSKQHACVCLSPDGASGLTDGGGEINLCLMRLVSVNYVSGSFRMEVGFDVGCVILATESAFKSSQQVHHHRTFRPQRTR